MKDVVINKPIRWLCTSGLAVLVAASFSMQAVGQTGCGGSIGITTDPNTILNPIQLFEVPQEAPVRVTVRPAAGPDSFPLTVDSVRYALVCTDNDDEVPCSNGNDIGAISGEIPITFEGLDPVNPGTCGVNNVIEDAFGPGTLQFEFPSIDLDTDGCTVNFYVHVNDKGTDSTPLQLTPAAAEEGVCDTGTGTILQGSATGSAVILVQTVPDIDLRKEISIDGGATWHDANDAGSAPYAEFPSGAQYRLIVENTGTADLTNIVINDPTLGLSDVPVADLAVGQSVTLDSGDAGFSALDVAQVCDSGGEYVNIATVDAESADDGSQVNDSDPATLVCLGIDVIKDGDDVAKVGDEVDYHFTLQNFANFALDDCTAEDSVLGTVYGPAALAVGDTPASASHTVADTDPNPLFNEVTLSCEVVGPVNTLNLSATDDHEVALIAPDITVTKSGPDTAKVGDEITYTIGFESTGVGEVENCTGYDTLLGDLGDFESGVTRDFPYTVPDDAPNPLQNTATITCFGADLDNELSVSAHHSLDLLLPDVSLTKECWPDPVLVGDDITWAITVENEGNTTLNCQLSDPDADIDEAFALGEGESQSFNNSRTVLDDDYPHISNTATVECSVGDDLDNNVFAEDTVDCAVERPGEEICRTPGFWGSRAGDEHRRSTNLTQMVIDAGGPLEICGQTIDNTEVGNVHSAVEAMCVSIEGYQQRQLARQLTAMALNCIVSGGGADCSGTSVEGLFADANAACIAGGGSELSPWIDQVDAFNNGVDSDCNERELDESTDIFDGVHPFPGPAGGSRACSDANGNGIKVVPAL